MDFSKTSGKNIKCMAMVAWEAKKPMEYTEIDLEAPKAKEVRVKVFSNALCHTDLYTLEGHDPEGLFPCVLGHEASAIVECVGEGVTSVKVGDIVIPCYTPECGEYDCKFCNSTQTNLCPRIRSTQGKGLMPDGTTRMSKDGKPIYHFMGCSTFAEYAVVAEISVAKVSPQVDEKKVCMLGCGISTGWGAAINNCKVQPNTSCVIYGVGAVGLSVIQACAKQKARRIVAVDLNTDKFEMAKQFGATECIKSSENTNKDLLALEQWGYDYTFDCTGNVNVMRAALEVAHRGWGQSCVIGVAAAGKELATRPFQLVTGRVWRGTAFGGWKSRTQVPQLCQEVLRGQTNIDSFITHNYDGLNKVAESIDALHSGQCLRAVVHISQRDNVPAPNKLQFVSKIRCYNGFYMKFNHYSQVNNCQMTFSIYLPDLQDNKAKAPPVLYYLSGLTCTDDNAVQKGGFAQYASEHNIAVVFPDTSPRGIQIDGISDSWDFGLGAGFYVDATEEKYKKHFNMYSYVTKELPQLIEDSFYVNPEKKSITGHSMGGHGALISYLKNPGAYQSVSAFAPISNPTDCPWGEKAFTNYLGNVEKGKDYDATVLIKSYTGPKRPIMVDQGLSDGFLGGQLKPKNFERACYEVNHPVRLRMLDCYDHSYFFISAMAADHFKHHAKYLHD